MALTGPIMVACQWNRSSPAFVAGEVGWDGRGVSVLGACGLIEYTGGRAGKCRGLLTGLR